MHYGELFKNYIKNKGVKQIKICADLNVPTSTMSSWLANEHPPLEAYERITEYFGDPIWKPLVSESDEVLPGYMTPEHADLIKASTELPVDLQIEFWGNVIGLLNSMITIAKKTKKGK